MSLNELTIKEALVGLKSGEYTSLDITTSCLNSIKKKDPKIKAFITVIGEQALEEAKKADELITSKGSKIFDQKPLLGIPYAAKDNYCTEGIKTTAASDVLKNFIPVYESTVTKKLKKAGAILLGKTNMDAWAHGSSTEESDFFVTKNPWDTSRVPGGSSGGSAAAVISDMCIFAIGSDTGGSIRCPASWCSITGFKPTYGRVSRQGIVAMASSTDSPGPMTKTVEDAAKVMNVIAGRDPLDATSSPVEVPNYLEKIDARDLDGLKIGRPRSYFSIDFEDGVEGVVNNAVSELENMGAEIIDIDLLSPDYAVAVYTIIQRAEVSSNLGRYDGIRYGNDRNSFGFEAKKRMMLGAYALSAGYYDEYYGKAQKVRTLIIDDFERAFEEVDVIVGPTMPNLPVKIGASEGVAMFGEKTDMMQTPGSMAGLSVLALPAGFAKNLPVGLQILGPQFSEDLVLSVGHSFQKSTEFHKERPQL